MKASSLLLLTFAFILPEFFLKAQVYILVAAALYNSTIN